MPCRHYGENLVICSPTITGRRARIVFCPTCGRRRRMYMWWQEWYGWHVTCLTCGEQWQDGEMLARPFCRGWRKENIAQAKKHLAEAADAKAESASEPPCLRGEEPSQ